MAEEAIRSVSVAGNGSFLMTGSMNGYIQKWDITSGSANA